MNAVAGMRQIMADGVRLPVDVGSALGGRIAHARLPRLDLWLATFLGTRQRDGSIRDEATPPSLGLTPWLALGCGAALVLAAIAANASRLGNPIAVPLLYVAVAALFLPSAARVLSPRSSRMERIALLLVVTSSLFLVRVIRAPIAFVDHDEFLHWATANDVLEVGRLFMPNPLLPVSPLYPGLELVTTALVSATGLSLFASALVVLAAARLTFVLSFFLFLEAATRSTRIASIACLVFMGSSAFVIFDLHFSYQSLSVPLLAVLLLATSGTDDAWQRSAVRLWLIVLPLIVGLALTHHLTSFFAAALLCVTAGIEVLRAGRPRSRALYLLAVAALALAVPILWSKVVGDPTSGYLGPVFESGFHELLQLAYRDSSRPLFVSDDGTLAPAWQRYLTMGGVAFICLGLLTGFLRALNFNGIALDPKGLASLVRRRAWLSSMLIVFTAITLAYPASVLFRLTRSGWEIGNRVGSLSFFGVAVVMAIAIAGFWHAGSASRLRAVAVAGALTVILIAGIISSEGPRILVPAKYEVSSDSSSIEPMGVSAAHWTREWLGRDHLFATDRINRLLVSTYGRQMVATTLEDWRDTSVAILSPRLGPSERALLSDIGVEYVMVDLRLTSGLPGVGVYFDGGVADKHHLRPPDPAALLKFNAEPRVDRPFDNGSIVMFDVRRLGASTVRP